MPEKAAAEACINVRRVFKCILMGDLSKEIPFTILTHTSVYIRDFLFKKRNWGLSH